ncbi:MAG: transcription-repair coupling factor [Anaerolineales bacterium]|nr:MAG: transcription-repair coupling factor [Anaerolineales bacterium]
MTASLKGLLSWVHVHPVYQEIREKLQAGLQLPAYVTMARARTAIIAALISDLDLPVLILTPTAEESQHTIEALQLWMPQSSRLMQLPETPLLFYERVPWPPETITDRLDVLSNLYMHRIGKGDPNAKPIVVSSSRALMQRTLPYRQFHRAARHIAINTRMSLTELTRHAVGIGYEAVSVVQVPGQLSRRGGLFDIYPPQSLYPYRLEFFGDVIDTIRTFEPETQRSTGRAQAFWLTPVREALPQDSDRARDALRLFLDSNPPTEVSEALQSDLEMLETHMPFPGLEFYLPYLYQEKGSILHYCPEDTLVILNDAEQIEIRWRDLEKEAGEQRITAIADKILLNDAPQPILDWQTSRSIIDRFTSFQLNIGEEGPLAEAFTPEAHFAGRLSEALGRIRQWLNLGDQVVVVSRQASRMAELWQDFNPPPVYDSLPQPPDNSLTFVQGAVPGGWQWNGPDGVRHLITDEELFGWRPPEPRRKTRRRAIAPEYDFADLNPGDYVVHEDYGIGVYKGLVTLSVDDIDREYLLLEYSAPADRDTPENDKANGKEKYEVRHDKLYVPIHQADRLTRYIGAEGFAPHLSRLGGGSWEKTKERIEDAADGLASELLDLYASRQVVPGHAFAPDSQWQKELEAAFPYTETQDQIDAIQAVKADMEKDLPMDRLICGDAGYGKTEVALRAAFKAVVEGKQVAMLVPTTVLAQQHYQTFNQRLASFPVVVELLSRFRTDSEQREVLQMLRESKADIVIGTHRLLQKDVAFKDLGLVIIDEEQRFGVAHKERLKQMRTEVDVLTLTATPIPRTLYMALSGVRDISIIETPPQDRMPIASYIGMYDADIARRSITRELKRGGQVFYVHNRVESIHSVAVRLRHLVPEARIEVGHGKMHEHELSRVMQRFSDGEVDVLLATTIIESGLDFPNANTLIVERADRFGLAQLYQLRGRVGRGTRRGYAYFFHKRRMTPEAEERLYALRETNSQGGGFSIALRDLEIRGAGELLGKRQHGQIAAVGFTLYTRILSRAVGRLKADRAGEPPPAETIGSITIELPLAVGLPPEYVPDDNLRLQLYRRLAEMSSENEIAMLKEELEDRFGPLPATATNLLYQLQLKVLARDARISAIAVENGQIVLRPTWLQGLDPNKVAHLRRMLHEHGRVGRLEIWLPLPWQQDQWHKNLRQVLTIITEWWQQA